MKAWRIGYLGRAGGWPAAWAWGLGLALGLRVGLGLFMGAVWLVVQPYLPPSQLTHPAIYGGLRMPTTFPWNALLGVWPRWDAIHFLNLAQFGYFGVPERETTYFFLYPTLTGWVSRVLGLDVIAAGLIVSTLAAVAALAALYMLVERAYGGNSAAWTVVALSLYPTAFFLHAPYSESLFLALTLGAFLAAYGRRWWLAGLLGALASLTRSQGMLTALALGWIAWRQWREMRRSPSFAGLAQGRWLVKAGVGLALPIAGGLAFFGWRQWVGFAPYSDIWREVGGSIWVNPVWNLFFAARQFLLVHDLHTTLDFSSLIIFAGLAAAMLINPRWRRPEWVIYVGANLGLFLSKHNAAASALQSLARYVLALFPAFIILGDWLARRGPRLRFLYLVLSAALLLVLSALYTLWWFIG